MDPDYKERCLIAFRDAFVRLTADDTFPMERQNRLMAWCSKVGLDWNEARQFVYPQASAFYKRYITKHTLSFEKRDQMYKRLYLDYGLDRDTPYYEIEKRKKRRYTRPRHPNYIWVWLSSAAVLFIWLGYIITTKWNVIQATTEHTVISIGYFLTHIPLPILLSIAGGVFVIVIWTLLRNSSRPTDDDDYPHQPVHVSSSPVSSHTSSVPVVVNVRQETSPLVVYSRSFLAFAGGCALIMLAIVLLLVVVNYFIGLSIINALLQGL